MRIDRTQANTQNHKLPKHQISLNTTTYSSKYHIKIKKMRCKIHLVFSGIQLPPQRTIHKLTMFQHGPSSKSRFIWIRTGKYLERQLQRLASQIAMREIGLHWVSWMFKLKKDYRPLLISHRSYYFVFQHEWNCSSLCSKCTELCDVIERDKMLEHTM